MNERVVSVEPTPVAWDESTKNEYNSIGHMFSTCWERERKREWFKYKICNQLKGLIKHSHIIVHSSIRIRISSILIVMDNIHNSNFIINCVAKLNSMGFQNYWLNLIEDFSFLLPFFFSSSIFCLLSQFEQRENQQ